VTAFVIGFENDICNFRFYNAKARLLFFILKLFVFYSEIGTLAKECCLLDKI